MENKTHAIRPLPQKKIGILGGASNVATVEYYKLLNDGGNQHLGGWDIPETLIAGMNFGNIEAFIRTDDYEPLVDYMAGHVTSLIGGGADLLLCVSNTLQEPFEQIMRGHKTPWIHIADPTTEAIKAQGLDRVALFGTLPVMERDYLKARYASFGLEVLVPNEEERSEIDRVIFEELVYDKTTDASKDRYLSIADRLVNEEGAQGLIMGCTEIFLLIEPDDRPSLPMFNTTQLHCDAALRSVYEA